MSDGPEQISAGFAGIGGSPIKKQRIGFQLPESVANVLQERNDKYITGVTSPTLRESVSSDSIPSIPNSNGVALTADQISSLSPQQREEYFVKQGLLPDLQTRTNQSQSRPLTKEEVTENLQLSTLLDRRSSILQNQSELRRIGETGFLGALQTELESIDRQIAALGNENLPVDANTIGTAATSLPNIGPSVNPNTPISSTETSSNGPYFYKMIDPLDDRYDFKTGQKIRKSTKSTATNFATPTGNTATQELTAQSAAEAASGLDPLEGPSAPVNTQSLPKPNYDPRGDQIAVNSPSAVRARLAAAERRIAEARAVAESTGYPGSPTYQGQEADIDLILNRGYINNAQ